MEILLIIWNRQKLVFLYLVEKVYKISIESINVVHFCVDNFNLLFYIDS